MKKFLLIFLAALPAVSCQLDYFPNDAVSSSSMATAENAASATIGNYSLFKSWINFSGFNTVGNTYIRHYQQLAELKGDNVLMSGKTTDPLFNDATMVDVSSDTNIDYFWFISYKINFATSVVINSIPEETTDPKLQHIKGENLFMRALSHMNLIQIFATPYSWDPNAIGVVIRTSSEDPVERATVGAVYDQVEKDLKAAIQAYEETIPDLAGKIALINKDLEDDRQKREVQGDLLAKVDKLKAESAQWDRLNKMFGNADGKVFRKIAQSYVLGSLVAAANEYMGKLTDRYTLKVHPGTFIIELEDAYQGFSSRVASTISGGESFLVSLSLALALSDIGTGLSVDTIFIDEGFGTLSGEPLQRAVDTLKSLNKQLGRHVGIISHIKDLREKIPVKIVVEQSAHSSASVVKVEDSVSV